MSRSMFMFAEGCRKRKTGSLASSSLPPQGGVTCWLCPKAHASVHLPQPKAKVAADGRIFSAPDRVCLQCGEVKSRAEFSKRMWEFAYARQISRCKQCSQKTLIFSRRPCSHRACCCNMSPCIRERFELHAKGTPFRTVSASVSMCEEALRPADADPLMCIRCGKAFKSAAGRAGHEALAKCTKPSGTSNGQSDVCAVPRRPFVLDRAVEQSTLCVTPDEPSEVERPTPAVCDEVAGMSVETMTQALQQCAQYDGSQLRSCAVEDGSVAWSRRPGACDADELADGANGSTTHDWSDAESVLSEEDPVQDSESEADIEFSEDSDYESEYDSASETSDVESHTFMPSRKRARTAGHHTPEQDSSNVSLLGAAALNEPEPLSGAAAGVAHNGGAPMAPSQRKRGLEDVEVTRLVKRACYVGRRMAKRLSVANSLDQDGTEVPFKKQRLKDDLLYIKQHILGHAGLGHDVTKLAHVDDARRQVKETLGSDHTHRAIPLDNDLMDEGWRCFDESYALDSFVMGKTGFGEVMAPRTSDVFAALRLHVQASPNTTGKRWSRFGGKNNQQVHDGDNAL